MLAANSLKNTTTTKNRTHLWAGFYSFTRVSVIGTRATIGNSQKGPTLLDSGPGGENPMRTPERIAQWAELGALEIIAEGGTRSDGWAGVNLL